jgi:hypothetical protein
MTRIIDIRWTIETYLHLVGGHVCERWIMVLLVTSGSHTNNVYIHTLSTVGGATEPIGLGTDDKLSQTSSITIKSGKLKKAALRT